MWQRTHWWQKSNCAWNGNTYNNLYRTLCLRTLLLCLIVSLTCASVKMSRLKTFQRKYSLEIPNNTINNISLPTSQNRVPGSIWHWVAWPWPSWRRWRRWPRVRPWPSPGDSPPHRTHRYGHHRPYKWMKCKIVNQVQSIWTCKWTNDHCSSLFVSSIMYLQCSRMGPQDNVSIFSMKATILSGDPGTSLLASQSVNT